MNDIFCPKCKKTLAKQYNSKLVPIGESEKSACNDNKQVIQFWCKGCKTTQHFTVE